MTGRPTLIGVPWDASSSFLRGPAGAPPRIREALRSPSSNSWTESIIDLDAPEALGDAGDVEIGSTSPRGDQDTAAIGADARVLIEQGIRQLMDDGGRPLALGGDHSVTYPILRAVRERHPALTILHVDAHADLYDEFEGDRYSHACPFARIMEEGLADRLIQVGIRTLNAHQRDQARRFGVEIIDMAGWAKGRRPSVDGPVYLSIDLDALDPSAAPGVSHWEPGGLTVRELLSIIQGVRQPVVGADVVEYNPDRDPAGITAMVAAKIVKEVASAMILNPASRG